jgi:hypothetical protein
MAESRYTSAREDFIRRLGASTAALPIVGPALTANAKLGIRVGQAIEKAAPASVAAARGAAQRFLPTRPRPETSGGPGTGKIVAEPPDYAVDAVRREARMEEEAQSQTEEYAARRGAEEEAMADWEREPVREPGPPPGRVAAEIERDVSAAVEEYARRKREQLAGRAALGTVEPGG